MAFISQHLIDAVMKLYYDEGLTERQIAKALPQLSLEQIKEIVNKNRRARYTDEEWNDW